MHNWLVFSMHVCFMFVEGLGAAHQPGVCFCVWACQLFLESIS